MLLKLNQLFILFTIFKLPRDSCCLQVCTVADQAFPPSRTMLLILMTIQGEHRCSIENVSVQLSLYHCVLDNQLVSVKITFTPHF
jgi:hypothetical protein